MSRWIFECLLSASSRANDFVHWMQLKGFSPVCTFWCVCRSPNRANDFVHWEQLYGFSPVWTLKCLCRTPARPNDFGQREHRKGFSSVWTVKCLWRLCKSPKVLAHWEQLKGFSLVCTVIWRLSPDEQENDLAQCSHRCDFSSISRSLGLKFKMFLLSYSPRFTLHIQHKNLLTILMNVRFSQ